MRALLLIITASVIWGCASSSALSSPRFTDRYDALIAKAVDTYWGDYRYPFAWKAQLYQESLLDPSAVSPVGAAGIAQFMPRTWAEITRAMGYGLVSPHDVEPAIMAGAYYMARLRAGWSSPRPADDRHALAAASYNAGFGNILKAQRICNGAVLYRDIIECLPRVTGRHSQETITYVQRIWRWWRELEAGS